MYRKIYLIIGIFLFLLFSCSLQAQIITTVAGNGVPGHSGDGGAATAAEMKTPLGVDMDSSGNIYIGENGYIRKLDVATGLITTVAGTGSVTFNGDSIQATSANISGNSILINKRTGDLYIADAGNSRIRKVDVSGIIYTVAGTGVNGYSGDGGPATAAQIAGAAYFALDKYDNLYFSDRSNFRIRKIDATGIITTYAGNGTTGYSGDGGSATTAVLGLPLPLACDKKGNLYIGDLYNYRIRKVDTSGIITTFAGTGSSSIPWDTGDGGQATRATLYQEGGIATDSYGNVYYSDPGAARIRKIDTNGIITTIAGDGSLGYSGDGGSATAAQLYNPQGICMNSNGTLIYFADYSNHVVRRIKYPQPPNTAITPPGIEPRLTLSPNPATDILTIGVDAGVYHSYSITNSMGSVVMANAINTANTQLDIKSLPAGVYYIRLMGNDGVEVRKFVKM